MHAINFYNCIYDFMNRQKCDLKFRSRVLPNSENPKKPQNSDPPTRGPKKWGFWPKMGPWGFSIE